MKVSLPTLSFLALMLVVQGCVSAPDAADRFMLDFTAMRYTLYQEFPPFNESDSINALSDRVKPAASKMSAWLKLHSEGLRAWQDKNLGAYATLTWQESGWTASPTALAELRQIMETMQSQSGDYLNALTWNPLQLAGFVLQQFYVTQFAAQGSHAYYYRALKNTVATPSIVTRQTAPGVWSMYWAEDGQAFGFELEQRTGVLTVTGAWRSTGH